MRGGEALMIYGQEYVLGSREINVSALNINK